MRLGECEIFIAEAQRRRKDLKGGGSGDGSGV